MPTTPYVVLSLAVSLDGRVAPSHGPLRRLGSTDDLERLRTLRRWADTLIVGAQTVRAIDPPMALPDATPRVVVLSRTGSLSPYARAFARAANSPAPWLVTACPLPPRSAFCAAIDGKQVMHRCLPKGRAIDLHALLRRLRQAGSKRIVVEGGGVTAEAFLHAGLLDELVMTYAPLVLGGQTNTMTPSLAWSVAKAPRFSLHHIRQSHNEVMVRWRRCPTP